MNSKRILIPALALSLLATAPAAEAATRPPKKVTVQKAFFTAKVEGVQTSSWHRDSPGSGGCDGAISSQGTEVARFAGRPFGVTVTYYKGLENPFIVNTRGRPQVLHPVTATVTRRGGISAAPTPAECGGTGGNRNVFNDCSTQKLNGTVGLGYSLATGKGSQRISLLGQAGVDDPYINCPGGQVAFPALLEEQTNGRPVSAKLPRSDVFDRGQGKIVVVGKGRRVVTGQGESDETTLSWKVTLTRVKTKKAS